MIKGSENWGDVLNVPPMDIIGPLNQHRTSEKQLESSDKRIDFWLPWLSMHLPIIRIVFQVILCIDFTRNEQ